MSPRHRLGHDTVQACSRFVQLSGFVRSQADRDKAVEIARDVEGATEVENGIQLK